MKNVLLLCERFPFGEGEGFLHDELFANMQDCSVTLIPVMRRSFYRSIKSFGNARKLDMTLPLMGGKKNRAVNLLKTVFCRDFWNEVQELRRTKRLCVYNIRLLLIYFSTAICAYHYIKDTYKDILSDERNPAIVYAYWLSAPGLTIVFLKRRFPHIHTIARCHGFDCLQERARADYLVAMPLKLKAIDRLFPASTYAANEISEKYPQMTRVDVRYLGTRPHNYRSVMNNLPFTVVSCSRVDANKNVGYLVEALAELNLQGTPLHWVLFGGGPLLEEMKAAASKTLKNSLVTFEFKGNCPNQEIIEYYNENNISMFIHSSKSEGGPVVSIMEALSFGIPIVALDAGGNQDSVIEGDNGHLLPKDTSPDKFAQAMEDILFAAPEKYKQYRQASYALWQSRFNAETNFSMFYQELCDYDFCAKHK